MPEKSLIEAQLKRIEELFKRKYFKISELDKKQHRLIGKIERATKELNEVLDKLDKVPIKEVRRCQVMASTLKVKIDAIKTEKVVYQEMRLKIKMTKDEYAKLKAELVEIELGEN